MMDILALVFIVRRFEGTFGSLRLVSILLTVFRFMRLVISLNPHLFFVLRSLLAHLNHRQS